MRPHIQQFRNIVPGHVRTNVLGVGLRIQVMLGGGREVIIGALISNYGCLLGSPIIQHPVTIAEQDWDPLGIGYWIIKSQFQL